MPYTETALVTKDDLPLFLRIWTPDATPRAVLIIVHGLGEHAGRYKHLVKAFLEQGYVVYGHDHRGFGRSGGKRGDYESFDQILTDLDQVVELARDSYPDLPLTLYAHSLGGMYGTHYLTRYEDKIAAAVLSAPGYGTGPDFSRSMVMMAGILNRVTPNLSIQTGKHDGDFTLSHCPDAEREYREDQFYHHTVTVRFAHTNLQKAKEAKELLSTLTLPVLVILGEDDRTINSQAIIEAAQWAGENVTFQRYSGCYHETHNETVEMREPILREVVSWLDLTLNHHADQTPG